MATPNLAIAHIATNQNQKEVVANSGFDALDAALCGQLSKALADADYALTADEALGGMVFVFTGTLTANRTITVPASKKPYVVSNQTTGGHSLIVKTAAGTGPTVAPVSGNYELLYCNGTNVVILTVNDAEKAANKGAANGYAPLDGSSTVPVANIPALPESQVTNLTTDLAAKAPLASPALTGTPTAPTPAANDSTTKVATTAFCAPKSGATGSRPVTPLVGTEYFDTTLGKPIWFKSPGWVDATGTAA